MVERCLGSAIGAAITGLRLLLRGMLSKAAYKGIVIGVVITV